MAHDYIEAPECGRIWFGCEDTGHSMYLRKEIDTCPFCGADLTHELVFFDDNVTEARKDKEE